MSRDILEIMTIAAIESDSAPIGSKLFDIHKEEFYEGYKSSMEAALKALKDHGYKIVELNE